jgi:phage shock protein PspC (stress-responsive transcriptional regulator)
MNKTVNINIGGLFFHIDEDAYLKLSKYFDAIRRSLANSSSNDEIMKDIEMRVAELMTDRQKSDKQVINSKDVEEVIAVMGQPEDYRLDDENDAESNFNSNTQSNFNYNYNYKFKSKKLYRDEANGMFGGVCTGLSHYFGIDKVWIRILFLIFVFAGFGTGILAYFILWIVTPKAITTSEKLEMTGEPINISNIEKKVREEFENVSSKFKNVDYDKMGNQIKYGAERAGSRLSDTLTSIFGAFAKVLGILIAIFSSFALLGICIASVILMFSSTLPENTVFNYINTPIGLETPLWIQGLLFLFVFGIPLFFLLLLGLKLLITNLKSVGSVVKYGLLALWIIAIGIAITIGIKEATQFAYSGKSIQKNELNLKVNDTLQVKFVYNDFYSKSVTDRNDFRIMQDSAGNEVIHSTNVTIHLKRTDSPFAYVQIEKKAKGKSFQQANERSKRINYNFKMVGNTLLLDNFFTTTISNKLRNQFVEVYLYLPNNIYYYPNENVTEYLSGNNADFEYYYGPEGNLYQVKGTELFCQNCEDDKYSEGGKTGNWDAVEYEESPVIIDSVAQVPNPTENKTTQGKLIVVDGKVIKTQ